jgi:hypothetical protein
MDLSGSWDYILRIAGSRLASNKTRYHIDQFGDELEIIGTAGEVAARRFLGMDEALHTGFDGGVDLLYDGLKVDVKTTRLTPKVEHRFLQYPIMKDIHADIVLMVAVEPGEKIATVLGYATKAQILRHAVNRDRLLPCREVPIRELTPPWRLLQRHMREVYRARQDG